MSVENEHETEGGDDYVPDLNDVDFSLTDEERGRGSPPADGRPAMGDAEWSAWVLSRFQPGERDDDGTVYIHGLRRACREVLGPVLRSASRVVQAPQFVAGKACLSPTVVEHSLLIRPDHEPSFRGEPYEVVAVADVVHLAVEGFEGVVEAFGNTNFRFSQHATATAATRAESIAYKKALLLGKGVLTAEEKSQVPTDDQMEKGFVGANMANVIDLLCKRANVDGLKFIGAARGRYGSLSHVPVPVGHDMARKLNAYVNGEETVPEALKGYKENWRKR